MFAIKLVVFGVVSLGLAYVSRASLLAPRSHGFYRFFAWELILVLALLNLEAWFRNPLSWYQIISWLLMMTSLFLVVHSARLLQQFGKPDPRRNDAVMLAFEKTTTLVTDGAYRYIRHPLYSSLLLLAWGIFFKVPSGLGGLIASLATLFLITTAKIEEAEDIRFFGKAYEEYMKRTRMLVPFLL